MRCVLWFGLVATMASSVAVRAASAVPPRIPVASFAALPDVQTPVLSPDGHWIAAKHVAEGKTSIIIIDGDHPDARPRAVQVGKPTITRMRWAGNARLLVQVRTTETVGPFEVPLLRLVAIDLTTGAIQVLDKDSRGLNGGDVLYVDPAGAWALVASDSDIYSTASVKRIDLASGATKLVEKARDNIRRWYADENGVVRAGVAYDGPHYTIWYRERPGDALQKLKGTFQNNDDTTVDRLIFHGGSAWVLTNARTGRFALYNFDVRTGTVGEPVYENPDVDVDDVYYDAATGNLSGVGYEDSYARVYWRDAAMKTLQSQIDAAVPNAANLPRSWSRDEKRVLIWSGSGADPGRYFLLDRNTNQMHVVAETYPNIDPALLAPVQSVSYHARDGLNLRAYLTLPRGRDPKSLPLIVLPHGGPFARDSGAYDPFVQFLANRGYAVLQPEFRGSTGFGKDFVAKGYGQMGKAMQDDLDDGVDWLVHLGQVDPKRVCIVGLSYGGYAALWGAIRNPDRYRCAVSWAGLSDVPAMMHYDREQLTASRYFRTWRKQFATDDELSTVSPIRYAAKLTIPVLIGAGEEDTTVPPRQSHKMVEALTAARANVSSVFYKDSKHDFGSSNDLADWLSRMEAFLAKYNPA